MVDHVRTMLLNVIDVCNTITQEEANAKPEFLIRNWLYDAFYEEFRDKCYAMTLAYSVNVSIDNKSFNTYRDLMEPLAKAIVAAFMKSHDIIANKLDVAIIPLAIAEKVASQLSIDLKNN
jgi:hypothetical protein